MSIEKAHYDPKNPPFMYSQQDWASIAHSAKKFVQSRRDGLIMNQEIFRNFKSALEMHNTQIVENNMDLNTEEREREEYFWPIPKTNEDFLRQMWMI